MLETFMLVFIALGFSVVSVAFAYSMYVGTKVSKQQELTWLQMDVAAFNAEFAGEEDDYPSN